MTRPLTILCVGDVFGEPGRRAIQLLLPKLKKQHEADLAIVNIENAASGYGVTPAIARAALEQGADVLTSGNHIWDKKEIIEYIVKENLLRLYDGTRSLLEFVPASSVVDEDEQS